MTFTNIKKRIASNIGYVDSSGDILTGKDITETDIGNWVNNLYLDDLVAELATQYPEDFEQVAKANFYKTSSTINSISGTTLVIDDANFVNSMVGDNVYNSTRSSYIAINSYTDTTTVELDSSPTDWVATDTVYILGHEFVLGGNATDSRGVTKVSVKYDSTATYYSTARKVSRTLALRTGNETYSTGSPIWYPTTSKVESVMVSAIGILPEPTSVVTKGIRIEYTQFPAELSSDDDTPRLPLGSHSILIDGGTAEAFRKLRVLDQADRYSRIYNMGKLNAVASYALTRGAGPVKVYPSRNLRKMVDRSK